MAEVLAGPASLTRRYLPVGGTALQYLKLDANALPVWSDPNDAAVAHQATHNIGGADALPASSTTVSGLVELATSEEAQVGTDVHRAVTPKALADTIAATTIDGLTEGTTYLRVSADAVGVAGAIDLTKTGFVGKNLDNIDDTETYKRTTVAGAEDANAIGAATGATLTARLGGLLSENVAFTAEGGLAVKLVNKTGSATVKGTIVHVYSATAVDDAFELSPVDSLDCFGVVYEAGVADGSAAWVVVSGIGEVLFKAATTRGQVARTPISGDTGEAAGYAMPMTVPANPNVLVEDHFREIGHILESKNADTLCKVILHFN